MIIHLFYRVNNMIRFTPNITIFKAFGYKEHVECVMQFILGPPHPQNSKCSAPNTTMEGCVYMCGLSQAVLWTRFDSNVHQPFCQ